MATIEIPDKVCSHCGGTRWRTEYKKLAKGNRVLIYRCAVSAIERSNKWKRNNPENVREHNITSCRKRRQNGYYKTPKERERSRLRSVREAAELCDNYIYKTIFASPDLKDISRSDIPKEVIEIKRKQLLLTRQIKNNGKDN